MNYGVSTRTGYIPNNIAKENQDSFLIMPNYLKKNDESSEDYKDPKYHLFGVCKEFYDN